MEIFTQPKIRNQKTMKTPHLILTLVTISSLAFAGPTSLTDGQAFLAASLAALSTPKMKEAPIKVNAALRQASGVQEDSGALAIVAIPDESADKLDLTKLAAGDLPLCRLWMKGCALKLPAEKVANIEQREVAAEGDKHSVTIWLLGVRMSAKGKPELILCANQKDPVLVLPLTALPTSVTADPPVEVSVEPLSEASQLVLTLRGTHQVKLPLE
jgi:hypothetical protein